MQLVGHLGWLILAHSVSSHLVRGHLLRLWPLPLEGEAFWVGEVHRMVLIRGEISEVYLFRRFPVGV